MTENSQGVMALAAGSEIRSDRVMRLQGLGAAFATLAIWSGYFITLRMGVLSPISAAALTLIRFAIPGLLLLPVFLKNLRSFGEIRRRYIAGIILGGGLPYFLLTLTGIRLSTAAYGSTLIPGTIPLFVSLLALAFYGQAIARSRIIGLSAIMAGVAILLVHAGISGNRDLLAAQGFFLGGSFLWSLFSISIRRSGLKPLQVASLVAVPGGAVVILWFVITGPATGFGSMSAGDLLTQVIVQGIIVGIVSGALYSTAIRKIGAEASTTIGAATPVVSALAAASILGESLDLLSLIAMVIIVTGVAVANGAFSRKEV